MKLHNIQDEFILKHLSKYIFVPNIDDLPLNKWEKRKLHKIKADYTYFNKLDKKEQKYIKAVIKANRVPLEQFYLDNKHNLFRFTEIAYNPLKLAQ
jgi:hypothetical protein